MKEKPCKALCTIRSKFYSKTETLQHKQKHLSHVEPETMLSEIKTLANKSKTKKAPSVKIILYKPSEPKTRNPKLQRLPTLLIKPQKP